MRLMTLILTLLPLSLTADDLALDSPPVSALEDNYGSVATGSDPAPRSVLPSMAGPESAVVAPLASSVIPATSSPAATPQTSSGGYYAGSSVQSTISNNRINLH